MSKILFFCALLQVALAAACGDNGASGPDASTDSGVTTNQADSTLSGDGENDATAITTTIRLAHLAPSAGTIDLCYRAPSTQNLVGPLFGPPPSDAGAAPDAPTRDGDASDAMDGDADVFDATNEAALDSGPRDAIAVDAEKDAPVAEGGSDGGPSAGLEPLRVTAYFTIPADGTFDIAIVPASARSCDNAVLTQKVTLDAGKHTTLVLMGTESAEAGAAEALGIVSLTDDPVPDLASFRVRMVNGAFATGGTQARGSLEVTVTDGTTVHPIAASVDPRQASTPSEVSPTVDFLGYHSDAPIAAPLSIQCNPARDAGGGGWTSTPFDPMLAPGSIHTGFIVGDQAGELAVLWCADTSVGETLTSCTLVRRSGL